MIHTIFFQMVDANQVWEVQEAIDWMSQLAQFKPLWIEEPTSPDDVLGHAEIAKALKPLGISVASGEMCCNRVLFKQFLQADAIQYCQIDSARIGGVNEILSVYLMAKKLGGQYNNIKTKFLLCNFKLVTKFGFVIFKSTVPNNFGLLNCPSINLVPFFHNIKFNRN